MSSANNRRAVNGILLLDKPEGITSNAALQIVKRLFAAEKAGHTGSLDPLASGMLPLCFGEATKFSQHLLDADKFYQVTAHLGITTATGDREGEILTDVSPPELSYEQLTAVLQQFHGEITQIPSMYSALKHEGKPLYKLARQGIEVERAARTISIHEIQLISVDLPTFNFEVRCSKGTYIRSLVEDIGKTIGCGAHVSQLNRQEAGPFKASQMYTLDQLNHAKNQGQTNLDALLLPIDSALTHWPNVSISEAAYYYLRQGQSVILPYAPDSGWLRLTRRNGGFLGIAEVLSDGKVAPRRLVQE